MAELSDGTLRYLLWIAALLTPRPPSLLVLNEPETSLHPDLLRPLAQLISSAAANSQIIAVSHSRALIDAICHVAQGDAIEATAIELTKDSISPPGTGPNVELPLRSELARRRAFGRRPANTRSGPRQDNYTEVR